MTIPRPSTRPSQLPERNLDVLRAVAVLCVLGGHLALIMLPGGGPHWRWAVARFGVLLFFVHTSLVLMASLERSFGSPNWVKAFYIRRAFRIYPLALVTLGAVLLGVAGQISRYGVAPVSPQPGVAEIVSNALLIQDLTRHGDIVSVFWTLPIEVQMYAVLPGLFLIARRGLPPFILAAALAVLLGLTIQDLPVPGLWRLNVAAFAPCFMGGVLAYALLLHGARPRLPSWLWPMVILAATGTFILSSSDGSYNPDRGWPMCLALGYVIPFVADLPASLVTRVSAVIAKYSYGIYLLHVPAMWIGFVLAGRAPVIVQWVVFGAAVVLLPWIAYHVVENRGILLGRKIVSGPRAPLAATTPAP